MPPATPVIHGSVRSADAAATRSIGRALGAAALPGTVLALSGELGAGKTQLAKGVALGLGVESVVNSPTFVLMNEHVGRLRLFHAAMAGPMPRLRRVECARSGIRAATQRPPRRRGARGECRFACRQLGRRAAHVHRCQ